MKYFISSVLRMNHILQGKQDTQSKHCQEALRIIQQRYLVPEVIREMEPHETVENEEVHEQI